MKYEFQWGEAHSVFSIYEWICSRYGPYAFGKPEKIDFVAIVDKAHVDSYASSDMIEEWRQMGEKFLDKNFAENLLKTSQAHRKAYFNLCNEFASLDLSRLSKPELFRLFEKLSTILNKVCMFFVVTQPEGTHAVEMHLKNLLRQEFGENINEKFSLLTMPVNLDIISREQLDLWKLAEKRSTSAQDIEKHLFDHAWLLYQTYNADICATFLKNRIQEEKKIGNFEERRRKIFSDKAKLREKQAALFSTLKNKEIQWYCKLFQHWSHERLELKNCWAGAEWRFLPLFKEISKRLQVALNDLMYGYTTSDVKQALLHEKLLDPSLVRERKELYAVRFNRGAVRVYRKGEVPALKKELGIEEAPRVNEVKGTVANPGVARGRAYVVRVAGVVELLEDEKNFREGDVMIITMTQPSHVPIVKKSAAVVADEGGVASHASVIAREFGKPCIVGAKIATKVIKTGDFIEVDADKGIVKKLGN